MYAEMYSWVVDLDAGRASVDERAGRRVVGTRQAPLKVEPIAEQIANAIITRDKDDPRLRWHSESRVRVMIGLVIPDDARAQTVQGRRRRFVRALTEALGPKNWRAVKGTAPHTCESTD